MNVRLPDKPRFGTPCNGCGLCCSKSLCFAGQIAFEGAEAPCPGLKISEDGSRTYCQLVATEIKHNMKPRLQIGLGVGFGCGMEDDDTPKEHVEATFAAWSKIAHLRYRQEGLEKY